MLYQKQGKKIEAEKLGLQIVEESKEALGVEDDHKLYGMLSLATTYLFRKNWEEAEQLLWN